MQLPSEGRPGEDFDPGDALVSFRNITVNVLFSPRAFFAAMRLRGGLVNPGIYLAGCVLVNGVIVGFLSKNIALMVKIVAMGLIFPFITAGILYFILTRLLGARGSYEAALRVNAYAAAVNLVSWFPVVGMLMEFYRVYVITVGLRIAFDTTDRQAFLAVAMTIALLMLVALNFGRLAIGP